MILIAFSPERPIPHEAEILSSLLPWVDSLHIRRAERHPPQEMRNLLDALPQESRNRIWIHDNFELAVDYHLGGIHLSRRARDGNKGLGVYAALHGLSASISCHNLDDLHAQADLYERVFICPVFDSISKPGHNASFEHRILREKLSEDFDSEIIALGGITPQKCEIVSELGFDGLAVAGALWKAEDPAAFIKDIHLLCGTLEDLN